MAHEDAAKEVLNCSINFNLSVWSQVWCSGACWSQKVREKSLFPFLTQVWHFRSATRITCVVVGSSDQNGVPRQMWIGSTPKCGSLGVHRALATPCASELPWKTAISAVTRAWPDLKLFLHRFSSSKANLEMIHLWVLSPTSLIQ